MLFSKFHKLNASQAMLDFVDVDNMEDTAVYVDPFAIEIASDPWSEQCAITLRVFFQEVLDALRVGDDNRALFLVGQLGEPRETFLGVSSGEPDGKGVGRTQSQQLLVSIRNSHAFKTGQLSDLSEMALFVDGVGRDKISDLTTNIIRQHLLVYTELQCRLNNILMYDYSGPPVWNSHELRWEAKTVKLPRIENSPVLLVPKWIVRRQMSLDYSEFYNKQITDFLIAEHLDARSSLVTLVKGKSKVFKGDVREQHPKSKSMISKIVLEHPELLQVYRKIAAERGELHRFKDDEVSNFQICRLLKEELSDIPSGAAAADRYHQLVQGALTVLFYPQLILPRKEWEINGGRKRIDIVFTNTAKEGFFHQRMVANNTAATMLVVECKNYSDDINNPEVDQLLGRFDHNRGKLGFVTFRKVKKEEGLLERLRDLAKVGNGYILPISDTILAQWLELKMEGRDDKIQESLHSLFRDLIS